MKKFKMWERRFSEPSNSIFENFCESVSFDKRLTTFDVQVNFAHAKALHKIGIFSNDELQTVLKHLSHIEIELKTSTFPFQKSDEDIYMAIERRLIELAGSIGAHSHTGKSRNDQGTTDVFLYLKKMNLQTQGHLHALLTPEKGLPLGYNRDLQEDKWHIFAVIDNVLPSIKILTGILQISTLSYRSHENGYSPLCSCHGAGHRLLRSPQNYRQVRTKMRSKRSFSN